jgi:hypothetical protein
MIDCAIQEHLRLAVNLYCHQAKRDIVGRLPLL